jgi:hypothetical protein
MVEQSPEHKHVAEPYALASHGEACIPYRPTPKSGEKRITDAILTLIVIAATMSDEDHACQPEPMSERREPDHV